MLLSYEGVVRRRREVTSPSEVRLADAKQVDHELCAVSRSQLEGDERDDLAEQTTIAVDAVQTTDHRMWNDMMTGTEAVPAQRIGTGGGGHP